ncbi:Uncharacterized protein Rs2_25258 [Raphanus sativus]|nr:Uncharacterized protein Rs2_25258 [Raphanus sativus]
MTRLMVALVFNIVTRSRHQALIVSALGFLTQPVCLTMLDCLSCWGWALLLDEFFARDQTEKGGERERKERERERERGIHHQPIFPPSCGSQVSGFPWVDLIKIRRVTKE